MIKTESQTQPLGLSLSNPGLTAASEREGTGGRLLEHVSSYGQSVLVVSANSPMMSVCRASVPRAGPLGLTVAGAVCSGNRESSPAFLRDPQLSRVALLY